jgi:DNA-binding response OmpR family regulator
VTAPPTGGERALAEARRRLDAGDAAAALVVLDRVGPQDAAYPFARQLRQQAERALHAEPSGVPRAGRP